MNLYEFVLENAEGITKLLYIRADSMAQAELEMRKIVLPQVKLIKVQEVNDVTK